MMQLKVVPRRYILYHPVFIYLTGFLAFLLIPSFFSAKPSFFLATLVDLYAMATMLLGAHLGAATKNSLFGAAKITIPRNNFRWLLICNAVVLFGLRLVHFQRIGIMSILHPFASEASLVSTVKGLLGFPYFSLLMTGWVLEKKRIYLFLMGVEVVVVIVPTLSRAYLIFPLIYYFFIKHFFVGLNGKQMGRIFLGVVILLGTINWLGPLMQAARSYIYIGQLGRVTDLSLGEVTEGTFLIERLNIHGNIRLLEGREDYVAELDWIALRSIYEKWLGLTGDYSVYPAAVANMVGNEFGFAPGNTVTGFPRNWILYHYEMGLGAVGVFNVMLGFVTTILYKLIYKRGNIIFPYLWFPLIYGLMFAQDALASAFVFGVLLRVYSVGIVVGLFVGVRSLYRCAKGAVKGGRRRGSFVLMQ